MWTQCSGRLMLDTWFIYLFLILVIAHETFGTSTLKRDEYVDISGYLFSKDQNNILGLFS